MSRRIARVDGRSKAAKRVKELAAGYIAQLGGGVADAATLAAVQKAAELAAVAEELRGRALRGESVDLGEMVKVQGIADRAIRALDLDRKRAPAGPTLAAYLAARNAEPPEDEEESEPAAKTAVEETLADGLVDGSEAAPPEDAEASA